MLKFKILLIILFFCISSRSFAQENFADTMNVSARNISWLITQLIPSPVMLNDANQDHSRLITSLRWNVIPVNLSFSANKYISPVQFFYINPVRRFTGSIELFVQPELSLASFKYGNMGRFAIGTGSRVMIPLKQKGEHLAMSLGGKYTFRKDLVGESTGYAGVEAGLYVLFNMIGLQVNYNFDKRNRYDFGMFIKFF